MGTAKLRELPDPKPLKNKLLELAKKAGFVMYTDGKGGIALLEWRPYDRAGVIVELLTIGRYTAYYAKWTATGEIERDKVLVNDGTFIECLVKAIPFIEWLKEKQEEYDQDDNRIKNGRRFDAVQRPAKKEGKG